MAQVENIDRVPHSCFQRGPVPAVVGIWVINQWREDFSLPNSLCLSTRQINIYKSKSSATGESVQKWTPSYNAGSKIKGQLPGWQLVNRASKTTMERLLDPRFHLERKFLSSII